VATHQSVSVEPFYYGMMTQIDMYRVLIGVSLVLWVTKIRELTDQR
jgi:hypothetical protein